MKKVRHFSGRDAICFSFHQFVPKFATIKSIHIQPTELFNDCRNYISKHKFLSDSPTQLKGASPQQSSTDMHFTCDKCKELESIAERKFPHQQPCFYSFFFPFIFFRRHKFVA